MAEIGIGLKPKDEAEPQTVSKKLPQQHQQLL